jgi:hypothetical protein
MENVFWYYSLSDTFQLEIICNCTGLSMKQIRD